MLKSGISENDQKLREQSILTVSDLSESLLYTKCCTHQCCVVICVTFICQCRKNALVANCTSVKIDLWLSSNTAEISLRYLTCCNKFSATISYICSPAAAYCTGCFRKYCQMLCKMQNLQWGSLVLTGDWLCKSSHLTLFSSQNKQKKRKEFLILPLLNSDLVPRQSCQETRLCSL